MNRRRMTGHRVAAASVEGPTGIRAPWAVYEMDGGSGVDSVENGPELTVTNSGPGKLEEGAYSLQSPGGPDFDFLMSGGSFGIWYDVQEGDPLFGGSGLWILQLANGVNRLTFDIGSDGTNIVLSIGAEGATIKSEVTPVTSAGWHHFGFVRNGDSSQFYVDGIACGTASNATTGSTVSVSESMGVNEGGGRFDQAVFAEVAYTPEEWAYIYNGGAGRAYEDWEITP